MCTRILLTLLFVRASFHGLAQEEDRYWRAGSEHVIINDSLHYRIEFREYPELGKDTGPKKRQWKYFEFDCAERVGSVLRKVRITSGWGMRVRDEEMNSPRGIKYEYTYVAPSRNLENRSIQYYAKLKSLTNPAELLEIREIKETLAHGQRFITGIEHYVGDSLLVSRVEIEDGKRTQVDTARYDNGRLIYAKGILFDAATIHHYRYDLDSTGRISVVYDSTDRDKTITKYHQGRPYEAIFLNPAGEIESRTRTIYSGDTLSTEVYSDGRGAVLGRSLRLRKWNAQKRVRTYSLDGSEIYARYFNDNGQVIKEVWKIRGGGEYTRVYRYLSGR